MLPLRKRFDFVGLQTQPRKRELGLNLGRPHPNGGLYRWLAAELEEHQREAGYEGEREGVGLDCRTDVVGPLVLGLFDDSVDFVDVVHVSLPRPRLGL